MYKHAQPNLQKLQGGSSGPELQYSVKGKSKEASVGGTWVDGRREPPGEESVSGLQQREGRQNCTRS